MLIKKSEIGIKIYFSNIIEKLEIYLESKHQLF